MNVFELAAVLTLDKSKYDKGLEEAEGAGSKFGKVLGAAAGAGAAAIGAASVAIGSLVKQSIEAYADYEQLTGGVETLFKTSGDKVMEYADIAYKTAGLSANEYMETVTSFSASLIQSLGGDTEQAAEYANMAIIDMSDNANKMGSSMESIQNAYAGFAKQNYTMLDNLKLGYGGTASEMYRLLEDAAKLDSKFAETAEFSMDATGHLTAGYADIVQAIHIVQDEMGITGTTSKEAFETISGSIGMTKSAWQNLVTGISNPEADIGKLVSDLVDSAGYALGNLLPVINTALEGVGTAIVNLAPSLSQTIVTLATDVAPSLIQSAGQLILTLSQAIVENLPQIVKSGIEVLLSLIDGIIDALPELIPAINDAVNTIVKTLSDISTMEKLFKSALTLILGLATGIVDNLPELLPAITEAILVIADTLTRPDNITMIMDTGMEIIFAVIHGLLKALPDLLAAVAMIIVNVDTAFGEKLGETFVAWKDDVKTWGKDLIDSFIAGVKAKFADIKAAFKKLGELIKSMIGFSEPEEGPLSDFHTYAPDMIDLFTKGIKDNEDKLQSQIASSFDFSGDVVAPSYASGYNINEDIHELVEMFRTGKAQTSATIENTRELGRAMA